MSEYKGKFAIGLLNINSIHEKFLDIKFILSKQLLDVLIIAESKLDSQFDDEDFKSINFNIHRRDRARRGGGLLLFIKKNVCVNFIKSDPVYEIVEMQLQTDQSERIVLLSCYRPQLNSEGF